jgi:hypothetical protein
MQSMGLDPRRIPVQGTYRIETNAADVGSNTIPLFPKNGKILLLDIEGCTTSIAFVKEKLFPYVLEKLETFVSILPSSEISALFQLLKADVDNIPGGIPALGRLEESADGICTVVKALMSGDVKATGLKSLQGKMGKCGTQEKDESSDLPRDFLLLDGMTVLGVERLEPVHLTSKSKPSELMKTSWHFLVAAAAAAAIRAES